MTDSEASACQSQGEAPGPLPQSPAWSTVVGKGLRKTHKPPNAAMQPYNVAVQARLKREQRRKMGIVGTSTESNIPVVKTKLVSVFATRFSPSLDAVTLCSYLTEKLGKSVTCRKIDSTRNRFSSFHVTAECNEVANMYDPQLWPAGTYVRRYFEARRPKLNGDSAAHGLGEKVDLQQQRPVSDITPVALQESSSHVGTRNKVK